MVGNLIANIRVDDWIEVIVILLCMIMVIIRKDIQKLLIIYLLCLELLYKNILNLLV